MTFFLHILELMTEFRFIYFVTKKLGNTPGGAFMFRVKRACWFAPITWLPVRFIPRRQEESVKFLARCD